MLKKLIIILGANGIGKSTTSKVFLEQYERTALVEADWCRAIPIIKLLRAYSRIRYKKEGKAFFDNDIDQINIGYLESWGFKRTNGRWYYKITM